MTSTTSTDGTTDTTATTGDASTGEPGGVVYTADYYIGQVNRIRVFRADFDADNCAIISFAEQGDDPNMPVTLPPFWQVDWTQVSQGTSECMGGGQGLPWEMADSVMGMADFEPAMPCTIDIDITATFPQTEPWVPMAIHSWRRSYPSRGPAERWTPAARAGYPARVPACFALLALYTLIFVLHLIVPGRWVTGYVRSEHTGVRLRYRLNGLRVMGITVGLYFLAGATGLVPWDYLYTAPLGQPRHRLRGRPGVHRRGRAAGAAACAGLLADLYLGRRENPQLARRSRRRQDVPLPGRRGHARAQSARSRRTTCCSTPPTPRPGVLLHAACSSFFLCEYLYFEQVHLYTYDFFAERVGFKLGWGCLAFYPVLLRGRPVVARRRARTRTPRRRCWSPAPLLFFTGWALARGANLQKFLFKTRPAAARLRRARAGGARAAGGKRLLVSGFWGLSRHINYLGEILMATGLALVARPSRRDSVRGCTRSTTSRCCCRASTSTTCAARRSTARCGPPTPARPLSHHSGDLLSRRCLGAHDPDRGAAWQQSSEHERRQTIEAAGHHHRRSTERVQGLLGDRLRGHRARPAGPLERRKPGVLVAPAQHTSTSTPRGPSSYHSASPSERLKALLAP